MNNESTSRPRATLAGAIIYGGLVSSAPAATAAPELSMAQIASAPFPSQLISAPHDDVVAWVYNDQGARNVWIARASVAMEPHSLTDFKGDDGVDLVELAWSGDGRSLYYTRGGDFGGEIAVNPTSEIGGPKAGEIWRVSVHGGAPQRISEGSSPVPVPNRDMVLFLKDGQPFSANADGTQVAPLFRDRGRISLMRWSPDGSKLAFVSQRPMHSLIGVYEPGNRAIRWMSPGLDSDVDPVWSRDGKKIAFLRTHRDGNAPYVHAHPSAYPWEIWVTDAATGQGRSIFQANAGAGSAFRALFNSPQSLFWTRDDKLVFPWEKTGWVRLYEIAAGGGSANLLTPGDAEIFGAVQTEDGERLLYTSNLGDIDRRHIWQLDLQSGSVLQLTSGAGVEDFPVETHNGQIFALRAEARAPLRPARVDKHGMTDVAPASLPADFPAQSLVEPELVTFTAADGVTVHGQLFVPRGRKAPGPALLFFHGGPTNRQCFAAWDPFETHTHLYEANQYLANRGYLVLSVNYRGGAGYGLNFREAKGFGAGGASELNDIIGAADYLRSRPDVDAARLGVWGGSYGGRMVSLALSRAPEYFAAGADYAGVHDWTRMPEWRPADAETTKLALDSSAIAHVDTWRAPVLLMQADADMAVPFEQTASLLAALRARNIPVETLSLPDEVHFLLRHQSWNVIFEATRAYMDRHLAHAPR